MAKQEEDHEFGSTLSAQVPQMLQVNLRPWVEQWIGENGLAIRGSNRGVRQVERDTRLALQRLHKRAKPAD